MKLAEAFANFLLVRGVGTPFISEAPCGTGKTYAYLVPLLYHFMHMTKEDPTPRRMFISTGGIALQEQLFSKDLPRVFSLMEPFTEEVGVSVGASVLKGVSNYLCAKAVEDNAREIEDLAGGGLLDALSNSISWRGADLSRTPPDDRRLLPLITTSSDECKKASCRFASTCGYMYARQQALGPMPRGALRFVVTNHHALVAYREEGRSLANTFILVDEAHELPRIYRDMTTRRINQKTWKSLIDQAIKEWGRQQDSLVKDVKIDQLVKLSEKDVFSGVVVPPLSKGTVQDASDILIDRGVPSARSELHNLSPSSDFLDKVSRYCEPMAPLVGMYHRVWSRDEEGVSLVVVKKSLTNFSDAFFSATIRHAGSYDSYLEQFRLGGRAYRYTARSPFDWSQQCLVVFPRKYAHLTPTKGDHKDYLAGLASAVVETALLSGGRAMVICSSWASARYVADRLRAAQPHRVFLQGELGGKQQLIQAFTDDVSSILVGTLSFWTGVDVPGEALSTLIIDKVPFRGGLDVYTEILKAQKKDWFMGHTLVEATTTLAQGFGRLIRSVHDRGVCVVLDPRIFPYGSHRARYAGTVLSTVFPETCNFSDDLDDIPRFLNP